MSLVERARAGDFQAACQIADRLLRQETASAYRKALPWLRIGTREREEWAQYSLGLMFDYGRGVRRNLGPAIRWYTLAAAQGYDSGQANLGVVYANLPVKRRNIRKAVDLDRRAARRGNRNAMYTSVFTTNAAAATLPGCAGRS